MKDIYIAGRYGRRIEFMKYAAELLQLGYNVTSRWIFGSHELVDDEFNDADDPRRIEIGRRFAVEDEIDLHRADTVISFTEEPGAKKGRARGGRHVEFGIAHALKKKLILIGQRENVFHCLDTVEQFKTWTDFINQYHPNPILDFKTANDERGT